MSSVRRRSGSERQPRGLWRRLGLVAALVAGLAVPLGPETTGPVAAAPATVGDGAPTAGPPDVLPAGGSWTVTLLTGEVIDVRSDGDGRVTAVARPRTEPFRTVRHPDGELYVIPRSVTPLIDDVLDLELFNVTGLVRQGYDDASIDTVPLIVQRAPGVDVEAALSTDAGGQPLPSIGAVATEVTKADAEATGALLAELGRHADGRARSVGGITRVWLDRQVTTLSPPAVRPSAAATSSASPAVPSTPAAPARPDQAPAEPAANLVQVGADRAWAAGFTGAGTTVAVLDTGVDGSHPDLAGKVVAEQNFSSSEDAVDRHGHGTHVASIVAGTGAASGGTRSGVAPDAQLISGKVVDDFGGGFESEAIVGMEWAAPQADVVNMSLGYGDGSDGSDPISQALDALTAQHDTLFVVAAANSGPLSRSVAFPGAAERALTVGAVDGADVLAEFSSRGPLDGSFELKPELVAPGVDIVAARAAGTAMGEPVDDLYTSASGTSMATPHAAGAAAVLAQQHPDWAADQLKTGLIDVSDPLDGDSYDVGAGRLDIGDGTEAVVRAEVDVVDPSLAHPRTEPHRATLTWTNTGTEPQTLQLAAELEDRHGQPVDAVAVAPGELRLAPGASGRATLTVDGPALDAGLYSGTVIADPEGGPAHDDLRTPLGVHAAPETAELTLEASPPPGASGSPLGFAAVVNLDDFALFSEIVVVDQPVTLSVPVGRYSVLGDVSSPDPDARLVAQAGDPDVTVDGPTAVTLDAAAAVPLHPRVEGVETAPPMYAASGLVTFPRAGTGGYGLLIETYSWHPDPPVHLTPMAADAERFLAYQVFRLQAPHLTVETGGEAVAATEVRDHEVPTGARDLTAVDAGDGSDLAGAAGRLAVVQLPADPGERAAVIERAAVAGAALLAFVDEQRSHLTLDTPSPDVGGGLPVVGVGGASAATLRAAAAAGEQVKVTVAASPYVYDVVTPDASAIDPEPVIDQSEQRGMATLRERFHRDPGGLGSRRDTRYPISTTLMNLETQGPLPGRRTAHVTPGVTWQSVVVGHGIINLGELVYYDRVGLMLDAGRRYEAGSRTTLHWLRRPLRPGPVGGPLGASLCQPLPVRRSAETMHVWLTPFQDGPDRFSCSDPVEATLRLERDGTVVGEAEGYAADFPVPAEPGTYRLTYEQSADRPYADHRSSTRWTFPSGAPDGPEAVPLPLLVVDHELPLDARNRPTGRTATLAVQPVTGVDAERIERLRVWTSTDDGARWRSADVRREGAGTFQVTLPPVGEGTGVSLRVDARDAAGRRIEQTLYDAYIG